MSFGGFGGDSSASSTVTAVSDQAQLNRDSTVAQGGSKQVRQRGTIAEQGALVLGDKAQLSTGQFGESQIKGNVAVQNTTTVNDPELLEKLTGGFNDTLSSAIDKFTASQSASQNASQSTLDKLTGLIQSSNTGGASTAGNTATKIILGALAIVAVAVVLGFWLRNRKA